jgi:eukaryotic-like serine/threonine-protein kinase
MSPCPPDRQIERFLTEDLPELQAAAITAHVESCPRCQSAIERGLQAELPTALRRYQETCGGPTGDHEFPSRLMRTGSPAPATTSEQSADTDVAGPDQPDLHADPDWPKVQGYDLLEELGRGGMGVVYKARHRNLNRLVALKLLLAPVHADTEDRQRFRVEAEAAAGLQHPNIVQVFECGEAACGPFLAMEYVPHGSLARHLGGNPQPVRASARLVADLARAVHRAHQSGIVHRDLKPANVLLQIPEGSSGTGPLVEVAVPKIADFGLAKRLNHESHQTQSGAILGTPSYMAPEQADRRHHPVGPTADLYSMGAILYELLTGRPPFRAETPLDTLVQVVHEEPIVPSQLRPNLPRDLETICLKCLQKDPSRRYCSGQELAEDLERFLAGRPVLARPVSPLQRCWRWCRRRPAVAALIATTLTAVIIVVAGLTAGLWALAEKQEATEKALDRERLAVSAKEAALVAKNEALNKELQTGYYKSVALAQRDLFASNIGQARRSLAECPLQLRHWEWHYLQRACHAEWATLTREGPSGAAVAFNTDGTALAVGHIDGTVSVWDVPGRKLRFRLSGHAGWVRSVAFSPDGARLASGSYVLNVSLKQEPANLSLGELKLWDAASGTALATIKAHQGGISGLVFGPDSTRLLTCGKEPTVRLWDVATAAPLAAWREHAGAVNCVAWSRDGQWIASGSSDKTVKILMADSGQVVHTLRGHQAFLEWVGFHVDGKQLFSSSQDGDFRRWDVQRGIELPAFKTQSGALQAVALSGPGQLLAFLDGGRGTKVVTVAGGLPYANYSGDTGVITATAFNASGDRLACTCMRGSVTIWDTTSPQEFAVLQRFANAIYSTALDSRALRLHVGSVDQLTAFDLRLGKALPAATQPTKGRRLLALRGNGLELASAVQGIVAIHDIQTGKEIRRLPKQFIVNSLAYDPAGKYLALAGGRRYGDPGEVLLSDAATGAEIRALPGNNVHSLQVRFSHDGSRLAVVTGDGTLQLWSADGARLLFTLGSPGPFRSPVAFSPDNRLLACGRSGAVVIWNVADGKPVRTLSHSGQFASSLAFHPDGTRLVAAAVAAKDISDLFVWEVETGQELLTMRHPLAQITDLVFTPDGHRLLGASGKTVLCWDATPLDAAAGH